MHNFELLTVAALAAILAGCGDDTSSTSRAQGAISTTPLTTATTQSSTTEPNTTEPTTSGGDGGTTDASATQGMMGPTTADSSAAKFDLGAPGTSDGTTSGAPDCESDPNQRGCMCSIPDHMPCDNGTNDPLNAMGLNCPGELQVQASTYGNPGAIGVRSSFGQGGTFDPREGSQYAVIGSGLVGDLDHETPIHDYNQNPSHCNDDLGAFDPGKNLPAPLKPVNVGGDCTQDLGLIGVGDCSNTIQEQFNKGHSGNDYTELRFVLQVPPDVTSFSYDLAFFSVEYPSYYGSVFNDLYIGWLESEKWTGNISFDNQGNPISLNAGFLEFKDDGLGLNPIPQFQGTCMRQHAGTNWLTTTAGVTPGETITVVFAIMDLSDSKLDSYAFIDNFQWGCEPTEKPQTMPPG